MDDATAVSPDLVDPSSSNVNLLIPSSSLASRSKEELSIGSVGMCLCVGEGCLKEGFDSFFFEWNVAGNSSTGPSQDTHIIKSSG